MLLTKAQIHWISTLTDNSHLLGRYFQLNATHILQKCRQKYLHRHVTVTALKLRRSSSRRVFIKYNQIRIRGGFARGRKRHHQRIWKYYGFVFNLRKLKKSRKLIDNRNMKSNIDTQPVKQQQEDSHRAKAVDNANELSVVSDKSDDTEFVYYQSSDEEEACIGIISSSNATSAYVNSDVQTQMFDGNANDAIESALQTSISEVSLAPGNTVDARNSPAGDETTTNDDCNRLTSAQTSTVDQNNDAAIANEENSVLSCNNSTMNACDVSDRLRQQLELLKKGKGEKISLLSSKRSERLSFPRHSSRSNSLTSLQCRSGSNDDLYQVGNGSASSTPPKRLSKEDTPQKTINSVGFIDSLINKIKSAGPADRPYETRNARKPGETQTALNKKSSSSRRLHRTPSKARPDVSTVHSDDLDKEKNNTSPTIGCTSPEFFGFDSVFKGSDISALLPTPRVRNSTDKQSVFVSEELDTFMKENALENVANVPIPTARRAYDEALLTEDAEPPAMKVPQRPDSMERPRTLAEKRILFEKRKDFRYLMIENESTIYHELRKRKKEGRRFDNSLLKGIVNGNIPSSRDCWRATCWLNTDHNRFFFQTIEIGNQSIKIFGGRGNNRWKTLCKIAADDKKEKDKFRKLKGIKCARSCPPLDKIKIGNFDEYYRKLVNDVKKEDGGETTQTLHDGNKPHRKVNIMMGVAARCNNKPGPLSSKVAKKRTSVDTEYGPYESFRLPTVQLEVWPKLEKPLPDPIQPYMKLLLPHENITDEWAKFAVCAVKAPQPRRRNSRKYKKCGDELGSFTFDIPYVNEQKRILVRRRRMHDHWETAPLNDDYSYEFVEHVDQSDENAVECADILSQMITSVAITANENRFIKHDPDIDYVGKLVPITSTIHSPTKALSKPKLSPVSEGSKTTKSKIM